MKAIQKEIETIFNEVIHKYYNEAIISRDCDTFGAEIYAKRMIKKNYPQLYKMYDKTERFV